MHTRQQAQHHRLTGWVRNLRDGRVEGVASGDEKALKLFAEWLHRGPELARVTNVEVESLEYQQFDGFAIQQAVYSK